MAETTRGRRVYTRSMGSGDAMFVHNLMALCVLHFAPNGAGLAVVPMWCATTSPQTTTSKVTSTEQAQTPLTVPG